MRVSSRLPRSMESNALTQALAQLRSAGSPLLDLTVSNPIAAGLDFPADILREALSQPEVSAYSPDPRGLVQTRKAVAAWHGHGVQADDVVLTASTSEAYSWLFKLLADPGDEVLVPSPSYPLFDHLARLEGVAAIQIPAFHHERWHLDLGALESACTNQTRLLIAVNPNNPTGQFLSKSEWHALTDLCARRRLALVVDEVFADYALEPEPDGLRTALEDSNPPCPVFVLSGLSKIAALPQVKLGWIIARGTEARELLDPLAFIADQFLSASASAQTAAPILLKTAPAIQARIRERLGQNLSILDTALASHPRLSRLPVGGGWTVLLRRPAVDDDETAALRILNEGLTLVHPGHFFDLMGDRDLVLSLLTPSELFQEGLSRALPLA
ncbi:MAG TPA: pyridoxal phosphate-dependent aminotransferase [Holophaga sp.]|nr:pyridoxal phosphate-dependent aminotransferase [Holophaga sp.]